MSTIAYRWGVKAAKIWLFENNFIEMRDLLPRHLCEFYAIKAAGNAVLEVAIKIETVETITTSKARDEMYRLTQWRNEGTKGRKIILFVPISMKQSAREVLGCYDEIMEFRP